MHNPDAKIVVLTNKKQKLALSLLGAEPISWRVDDQEYLWQADPDIWDGTAPLLFPVVGACRNGSILVEVRSYPMPQHGFAKDMEFVLIRKTNNQVHLRLGDTEESRKHFPFAFQLDVEVTLLDEGFAYQCKVTNTDHKVLPYAIGFHPGINWPAAMGKVVFEKPERPDIPKIVTGGLLSRQNRKLDFDGETLLLEADIFQQGALVFRDAKSKDLTLINNNGEGVIFSVSECRHLALWSKPQVPFLCLEAWSSHADWEGFSGEIQDKDTMVMLPAGQSKQHGYSLKII
ncbi:aldose 1-epimerase family protein [Microvirga sp. W0021]|uniref:Aldose 1-epimerase family protein n=1 Tax=Hohaiivirga grylli TaxID=3133970 RepID=A0ABV0BIA1_9HYPH